MCMVFDKWEDYLPYQHTLLLDLYGQYPGCLMKIPPNIIILILQTCPLFLVRYPDPSAPHGSVL